MSAAFRDAVHQVARQHAARLNSIRLASVTSLDPFEVELIDSQHTLGADEVDLSSWVQLLANQGALAMGDTVTLIRKDHGGSVTWVAFDALSDLSLDLATRSELDLKQDASTAATDAELAAHAGLTTTAHGGIVASTDPRLTNSRPPSGGAGGDLTGNYPNPLIAAAAQNAIVAAAVLAILGAAGLTIRFGSATGTFSAQNLVDVTVPHGIGRVPGFALGSSKQSGLSIAIPAATNANLTVRFFTTSGANTTGTFGFYWLAIG